MPPAKSRKDAKCQRPVPSRGFVLAAQQFLVAFMKAELELRIPNATAGVRNAMREIPGFREAPGYLDFLLLKQRFVVDVPRCI